MTTKCNYDCNENGLSLNYFSFSLQSLPQDGVEINARPFPVLVILFVIRIKHHNWSISCILRRMAGEEWPEHRLSLHALVGSSVAGSHQRHRGYTPNAKLDYDARTARSRKEKKAGRWLGPLQGEGHTVNSANHGGLWVTRMSSGGSPSI